ncbi:Transmembrane-like protein [Cladobotryum mycophilum]|uniref:Transmembrane-like protein n=1 Tax=Cladobotryum mycophilum TaxID=491253 RepID=A0ABR0SGR9_9HYPO
MAVLEWLLNILPVSSGSEIKILGPLNFHDLARIIAAGSTLISVVLSIYLIWMHATHYTQPREQRHIIRILFMVPIYAISSYMQIQWYWHAIYFQVLSDCYEAFAIASFYGLLCHYCAPDLHSQKEFFRNMRPVKGWVWPLNWFAKCCGGERGPWRTPKSGLTWFNIIWVGVYQYCFIRVAMTITAVITQHHHKYCESSNSPVFAHIWVLIINALAVTIAMFCLIQFYVQLSKPLAEHNLFIKILAIKLVVFLSFWQATAISVGTSTLKIVHPNKVLAYPDIKVGIPALLLCVEMAIFAILHLWAFPYKIYRDNAGRRAFYPDPDPSKGGVTMAIEKRWARPSGGFLGIKALWDALNLWDFVKAFGRGMRWLMCGVKKRKEDVSYNHGNGDEGVRLDNLHEAKPGQGPSYTALHDATATQYHGAQSHGVVGQGDESAGLIHNAQPNPETGVMGSSPPSVYHANSYHAPYPPQPYSQNQPYDPPPYVGRESSPYNSNPYDRPPPSRPARPDESPRRF